MSSLSERYANNDRTTDGGYRGVPSTWFAGAGGYIHDEPRNPREAGITPHVLESLAEAQKDWGRLESQLNFRNLT